MDGLHPTQDPLRTDRGRRGDQTSLEGELINNRLDMAEAMAFLLTTGEDKDVDELKRRQIALRRRLERLERRPVVKNQRRKPSPDVPERSPPPSRPSPPPESWIILPDQEPNPDPAPGAGPYGPEMNNDDKDLEFQIGARWFPIVGGILLVLGVVFFLVMAIERGWVNPLVWILLGTATGFVVWVFGAALHFEDRFVHYGQVVSAVGALILYFSVFSAHQFDEYRQATGMTMELGSVLLVVVSLAVLVDAVLRRGQAMAGMALALLVATTLAASEWAPFSVLYTFLMSAAIVTASAWRGWAWLELTAVPVVIGIFAIHMARDVAPEYVLIATSALLVVFVFTGTLSSLRDLQKANAGTAEMRVVGQIMVWMGVWGLALWALGDMSLEEVRFWRSTFTGGLGLLAIALSLTLRVDNGLRAAWGIMGLFFVVLWVPLQLEGVWIPIAWSGVVLVLFILTEVTKVKEALSFASMTLVALLVVRLFAFETLEMVAGQLDPGLALLPFSAGVLAVLVLYIGSTPSTIGTQRIYLGALLLLPLFYLGGALSGVFITFAWASYAVAILVTGFAIRNRDMRIGGLFLFAPVLVRVAVYDLQGADPVWHVLSYMGVGLVLLTVSYFYALSVKRRKGKMQQADDRMAKRF